MDLLDQAGYACGGGWNPHMGIGLFIHKGKKGSITEEDYHRIDDLFKKAKGIDAYHLDWPINAHYGHNSNTPLRGPHWP